MGFLATGEIENIDGKEENEVEGSERFGNLEDTKKKTRKKHIEVKAAELEIVTKN